MKEAITDINQLDPNKHYSYADYLTWQFKERVELIKGRLFKMSPAPSRMHQKVSIFLASTLYNLLRDDSCEVYDAPFDVVLEKNGGNTVVQPDICVICDPTKLTDRGCTGAPDLIIEILSPGNSKKEMKEKFELYEENGVQEYWMVSLSEQSITVYHLNENDKYIGSKPYVSGESVSSNVLTGFSIDIEQAFRE